jgi:molecular chaperone DnaK (HSP70)
VAYATPRGDRIPLGEIGLVKNYGPKQNNTDKVPSVVSFSPPSNLFETQWGYNLSPDAISMVQTKLALDVQDVSQELEWLVDNLDGMKNLETSHITKSMASPEYTYMSSEDVVTDYLSRVVEHVLDNERNLTRKQLEKFALDIVITVPTGWSDAAKNSTYRAVMRAGFDQFPKLKDVMMITEPEAGALYAARFLKDEMGKDFLKVVGVRL